MMKKILLSVALQIFLTFSVFATTCPSEEFENASKSYPYHDQVDHSVWEQVTPYFLPEDHPIKQNLDKIFQERRVTKNVKSLKKSDFKIVSKQSWSDTYVVSHKNFKGYLFKLYLDSKSTKNDWANWLCRIRGAQLIQEVIDHNGYQKYFKVPKKWIYPLPEHPSPGSCDQRKNFILVVEDMNLFSEKNNILVWQSKSITPDFLDALFVLLQEVGLSDSIYTFNIPFSIDGRVAHIDTEFYHNWPVNFNILTGRLSKENQAYWNMLITNGGPP